MWGDQLNSVMDVVQDIVFPSREAADQGLEKLRAALLRSNVIDGTAAVMSHAWWSSGVLDVLLLCEKRLH